MDERDECAEFDMTEQEFDSAMAYGEPVELVFGDAYPQAITQVAHNGGVSDGHPMEPALAISHGPVPVPQRTR